MDTEEDLELIRALFEDTGQACTVSRVASSYDPTEGAHTVTAIQTDKVQAVNLPATKARIGNLDNGKATEQTRRSLRFFYVTATPTFKPAAGDLIGWLGDVLTVLGCTPFAPSGVVLFYSILAEKSNLSELPAVS